MRSARDYLGDFLRLGRASSAQERRSVWRQSMATLAASVTSQRPVPFEGYSPDALRESAAVALTDGLVDDVGFLSPPAAAAALYELAAAVPESDERRELGRRVFRRLQEGDAATFVALATRIAMSSQRALQGGAIRARVALALDLPIGIGARADALALALISRREVEREWLTLPSTGSLPARRLAARLLERAAREAARRAAQGDDSGLRVFETPGVEGAWQRLLADREPLVWRHVAVARGLLSEAVERHRAAIDDGLHADLTPTEWRRAAASLAARIAVAPEAATAAVRAFVDGPIPDRDRGVVAAVILGMPRAAEAEPAAVEELLPDLIGMGGVEAAGALVELRREELGRRVGQRATELARMALEGYIARDAGHDDGKLALMEALMVELSPVSERGAATLTEQIDAALMTFVDSGAPAAHAEGRALLDAAEATLGTLLLSRDTDSVGRRHAYRALRELDQALLQKDTLSDLLQLGGEDDGGDAVFDDLFEKLSGWLVAREETPIAEAGHAEHLTLRIDRMRTMLHLVDADGTYGASQPASVRRRRLRHAKILLSRVQRDADSPLRRVVCAAASRACDALVSDEICEVSDVLVVAAEHVRSVQDLTTLAEASMVPEIEAVVRAYAGLEEILRSSTGDGVGERACLDGVLDVAQSLPVAISPRVEALRASLLGLVRALEVIAAASSLGEVAEGNEGTLLSPLETAVQNLAQLVAGARRRLGDRTSDEPPSSGAAIRLLDFCVERALRGGRDELVEALRGVADTLREELPGLIADVALTTLARLAALPEDAPRKTRVSFIPAAPAEAPLPAWLPPSRTLGGFYVLRALGAGAVGSVFVAKRADERHDETAARFALKVPEYDGAAARTLSETEFLQHFRQEAGALLSLPTHDNLATFVTFDVGARPKPILVMELVEGPSLARVIAMKDLDTSRAFDVLEGIANGLATMHAVGVGHLDVKPSNVILRDPDGIAGPARPGEPVLVDFGLAGRHLRPGCGTGEYGAPEIWGSLGPADDLSPSAADVYAFGCLIYEVLTSRTLFSAPHEMALIAHHVAHDGMPEPVAALAAHTATEPVAELLHSTLRQQPDDRIDIVTAGKRLRRLRERCQHLGWPL
jgi:hypothetical protein